jgi:hypothetical protein
MPELDASDVSELISDELVKRASDAAYERVDCDEHLVCIGRAIIEEAYPYIATLVLRQAASEYRVPAEDDGPLERAARRAAADWLDRFAGRFTAALSAQPEENPDA